MRQKQKICNSHILVFIKLILNLWIQVQIYTWKMLIKISCLEFSIWIKLKNCMWKLYFKNIFTISYIQPELQYSTCRNVWLHSLPVSSCEVSQCMTEECCNGITKTSKLCLRRLGSGDTSSNVLNYLLLKIV